MDYSSHSGLGLCTFQYAEGLSYLSDDPKACNNCHVMNDNYRSWQAGAQHQTATCNDCHAPRTFPAKFLARLQDNCIRCHGAQINRMESHPVKVGDGIRCTECHAAVGHMEN